MIKRGLKSRLVYCLKLQLVHCHLFLKPLLKCYHLLRFVAACYAFLFISFVWVRVIERLILVVVVRVASVRFAMTKVHGSRRKRCVSSMPITAAWREPTACSCIISFYTF